MTKDSFKTAAAVAITIFFWGSVFVAIRYSIDTYTPVHLALMRYLTASVVMLFFVRKSWKRTLGKKDSLLLIISGVLGIALFHLLLNSGEQTVTAGSASFIASSVPIFTAIMAYFILRERLRLFEILCLVTCIFGVFLISNGESEVQFNLGILLITVAAILEGIYFIVQGILVSKMSAIEAVSYSIWIGTLCLLPFAYDLPQYVKAAPWEKTAAAIYLGVFPTALAYTTWSYAISKLGPYVSSMFLFLVPFISLIMSALWINETPAAASLYGGGIILISIASFSFYRFRQTKSDSEIQIKSPADISAPKSHL